MADPELLNRLGIPEANQRFPPRDANPLGERVCKPCICQNFQTKETPGIKENPSMRLPQRRKRHEAKFWHFFLLSIMEKKKKLP